ncbi:MAG TPA: dihydrodipicolinate synthase family protein [Candidatus Limnocylindrales bacterium]
MDASPLSTVVAVPPTPFLEDGALDEAAFASVLARAIDGGLRAVTIAGNTGEFGALSAPEIERLIEIATGVLKQDAVLLVGTGGDLPTAGRVASKAAAAGAFGVMIHEPAGPFRSPEGWIRYHAELAAVVPDLAVVPYVRDATIRPEDLRALVAAAPNVVAVKYAVPDPVRFAEIVTRGPRLLWICGLAERWAPFFWPAGAAAFTSGLALVEPRLSLELLEHLRGQRLSAALATWSLVAPFEALRARNQGAANVPAIKEALALRIGIGRTVRPPISELGSEDRREVSRILASWDDRAGSAVA